MQIYDISLTINPDMVVWPGEPKVQFEQTSSIAGGDMTNTTSFAMSAHTGTHVDAPLHFLKRGKSVEKMLLKMLVGRAYVLDLPRVDLITKEVLEKSSLPPRTRRVLIKTKNSKQWRKRNPEFNEGYVALTDDAAKYLIQKGVKLVGIDYLSIAPFDDLEDTHKTFLKNDIIVLEGLDLSEVSQGRYNLTCLPMKLKGADGAPARAILEGV